MCKYQAFTIAVGFARFTISNDVFEDCISILSGKIPIRSAKNSKKCVLNARNIDIFSLIINRFVNSYSIVIINFYIFYCIYYFIDSITN